MEAFQYANYQWQRDMAGLKENPLEAFWILKGYKASTLLRFCLRSQATDSLTVHKESQKQNSETRTRDLCPRDL